MTCPPATWRVASVPWPSWAIPRDGKKGKLQITYGLICSPQGRPVAVRVHEGNTQDQQTLPSAVAAVSERFGIERVIFVGDRGMCMLAYYVAFELRGQHR